MTTVLPRADEKARVVEQMFDRVAGRYDLLNRLLTFGMDIGWRRATVRSLRAERGARVLDVACGTGDLCRDLESAGVAPVGIDFSAGMLAAARTTASLVRGDALRLPFPDASFTGLTCGFALRNFTALGPFFDECARVLQPGGRFAFLDVAEPASPIARAVHGVWFRRVVPIVGGIVSDRRAYAYLPASTAYLPKAAELVVEIAHHGFERIEHRVLGAGAAQLVTGARAHDPLARDAARRLVARTEAIADPGDLLLHLGVDGAAFLDGDAGFVTAGVAACVDPDDARSALAAIEHERDRTAPAGSGPRAVGALAFAGGGRLVIPARVVARDADGQAWRTTIAGAECGAPATAPAAAAPSRFSVTGAPARDVWNAMVDRALAAIAAGDLEKIVLARTVDVTADAPFSIPAVLDVLRRTQPGCTVYADGDFVGASPELLVQRQGPSVVSRPMAGTGDDPTRLLASAKDGWEHRIVVDAVVDALAARCADVRADGPTAMRFADVTHLATTITGNLVDGDVSALDLARLLHPTPAVGGWPRADALTLLHALEAQPRDRYAGPFGWVDAAGDGAFVIALRCARLDGATARLYAGAGIVAGSEAGAEWAETQAKLEPMLRALVRP